MPLIYSEDSGFEFDHIPVNYYTPTSYLRSSFLVYTEANKKEHPYIFRKWSIKQPYDTLTKEVEFLVRKGTPFIRKNNGRTESAYRITCSKDGLIWINGDWVVKDVSIPCFKKLVSTRRLIIEIENRNSVNIDKLSGVNRTEFIDIGHGMQCLSGGLQLMVGKQKKLIKDNQIVHLKTFLPMRLSLYMKTEKFENKRATDFHIVSIRADNLLS